MATTFTGEEIGKIQDGAKPTSELPIVYEDKRNPNKPISRVYEAHLLLVGDKAKRDALEWIDKSIETVQSVDEDRNSLFTDFHSNLSDDNTQQLTDISSELRDFESFRKGFTKTKLNPVELGWLVEDISEVMNKVQERRTVQEHKKALLNVLLGKFEGRI